MTAAVLVLRLVDFYEILIIAYILMSWIRPVDGRVFRTGPWCRAIIV